MIDFAIFICFPFVYLYSFINQYKIMQSYHYEMKRYFKHNYIKKIFIQLVNVFILALSFFVGFLDKIIFIVLAIILNCCFMYEKPKLKLTKRVKRCIAIYFIFNYLLALIFYNKFFLLMLGGTLFYLNFIVVNYFSCLLESIVMYRYIKDAKRIIKNVKVIGITGSYGKTSCKNIIFDMLSVVTNVSKTPKSYNNKVGIVKSIRECVNENDDYFICEYGVDRKGAIDKLLRIVKPNISLITEVGPQHIVTFKNIENIKKEKIKLAKILNENEYTVINNDNVYLREEISKLSCKVITYGIRNNSDIMAKNIIMNNRGSTFDLYVNNQKYKNIRISLLGEHNILNVLGAIGVLKCLDVDMGKIDMLVDFIKPIEHRLEIKKLQGIKIIDDGFNSNEVGFKKAVDVLGMMNEEKYIITPGIIEQGDNSEIVNCELGKYMADKIDFAILVGNNANILKNGLLANGFNEKNVLIKKDFMEAWEYIKNIATDNKIFLIENDLPSIYLK